MVKVVPVRLDREVIEFIGMLVELGIYGSRSEALRELIKTGIGELRWMARVNEAVEKLFKLEGEGGVSIKFEGALEQLLRERGRF